MMLQTVSVDNEMALVDTSSGWTTFSASMSLMQPCATWRHEVRGQTTNIH
jgi:hypothetical protein